MNRRNFLGTLPILPVAAAAPEEPRHAPMPDVVAAAVALGDAIDELFRLEPEYAPPDIEAFEDDVWFPAVESRDRAEQRLVALLREHDLTAVVVRGRLYLDTCRQVESTQADLMCDVSVLAWDEIVNLDAAAGK
jgi:hypothetical protein